jgi:hypothetical protein
MSKVKLFSCYDYNEEWYLIEMLIDENSDDVDLGDFIAPDPELDEGDWQCPYNEQYLNEDGTELICEPWDEPEEGAEPCRIAFFLFKYGTSYLQTPYGDFSLDNVKPLPERLAEIIEFEECD